MYEYVYFFQSGRGNLAPTKTLLTADNKFIAYTTKNVHASSNLFIREICEIRVIRDSDNTGVAPLGLRFACISVFYKRVVPLGL